MTIHLRRFALLAFTAVLSVAALRESAAASGQMRWGSDAMPNAGVCFFRDKQFRGEYFCVRAGESVARVPGDMNDEISSLRVIGRVDVQLFKDDRFKGQSGRYFTDVRDLKREGWNDAVSSLRVGTAAAAWDDGRFPVWGRDARAQDGACFYKDAD